MLFIYFFILFYVVLLFWLLLGFKKIKKEIPNHFKPVHSFSIIISFRNEAKNLPFLIQSIEELNYPFHQFEVIFVDDDSSDGFQFPELNFTHQLIHLKKKSNSPKKEAIQKAISSAKHKWIVTTDADCVLPNNWLLDLNDYILTTQKKMVCGPVFFNSSPLFLTNFQQTEMLALQAVTIGSFGQEKPFMCNGANFAYTKKMFEELNGFEGNENQTSGDDVFLLQKAVNLFPDQVGFLLKPTFVVKTNAATSWNNLFEQRVRWASKSTNYSSSFGKLVAVIVLCTNFSMLLIISFLFWGNYELFFLFLLKVLFDVLIANQTAKYYKIQQRNLVVTAFVYPFFSTFVAIYSLFGKYSWKGRTF